MKRQLLLTLFLLFVPLTLGITCEYGSYRIAHSFQNDLLPVARAVAEENWDQALLHAETLAASWQKTRGVVQLWINHSDIDHVSSSLIDLRAALIAQDLSSSLSAYGQCSENFGHLHHRDAFTLRNIL